MENQNHHFDDISFRICLVEEADSLFSQEEDGHISGVDSKQTILCLFQ